VLDKVVKLLPQRHKPGIPTDPNTTMGSLVSRAQLDKVMGYVAKGLEDGGRLVCGGKQPDDPALKDGFFYEATVFADMQPHMRLAQEEVFGPILSVFKWSDEDALWPQVNGVDFGLTGSIWTQNLNTAHPAPRRAPHPHRLRLAEQRQTALHGRALWRRQAVRHRPGGMLHRTA
jgi:betaine-aldehyde dehydrogenase